MLIKFQLNIPKMVIREFLEKKNNERNLQFNPVKHFFLIISNYHNQKYQKNIINTCINFQYYEKRGYF